MSKPGTAYEQFVASIQQAILYSETFLESKNIAVEPNKKILDNNGIEREFDIYWEYNLGGFTYKTVIECKDYNSDISIDKIDALVGKIQDLPDLKAAFATRNGYQSGAETKAAAHKIDLLIVREQNDADWQDEHGNPYSKVLQIDLNFISPAQIVKFHPIADRAWVQENTDIDIAWPLEITGEIIIENLVSGERYSLNDLQNRLGEESKEKHGAFKAHETFENAFIHFGTKKIKLKAFDVEYILSPPTYSPVRIDLTKELVGVVEYLQKGVKKSIFKQGIVREGKLPKS